MKQFFLFTLILASSSIFAQKRKTIFFIETELLIPAENTSMFKSSKVDFSFGFGLGLNLNSRIGKNFSILYGLEYASVRRNFLLDGFSTFASFARFKFPIYFQYKLNLDRHHRNRLHFMLGGQLVVQGNSKVGGVYNSNYQFIMINRGGVFPLVSFGFGYEIEFRNGYFINIKSTYNMGFIDALSMSYEEENTSVGFKSKLSHFNIKFSFPLILVRKSEDKKN